MKNTAKNRHLWKSIGHLCNAMNEVEMAARESQFAITDDQWQTLINMQRQISKFRMVLVEEIDDGDSTGTTAKAP